MSMGGGGGGAAGQPSLEERGYWFQQANPEWSQGQAWDAAMSQMNPMQYENWSIGKQMVRGTRNDPGAIPDIKRYGLQMSNLAQGGLMVRGMDQLRQVYEAPDLSGGIQARMGARMGLAPTMEQQAAMNQQAALANTSSKVGLTNAVRANITNAQRDMRFGGLQP